MIPGAGPALAGPPGRPHHADGDERPSPEDLMPLGRLLKRLVFGRPLASEEAGHQLLPKVLALPVFASDALSSNAYATEEILLVLIAAGTGALGFSIPIAAAVGALLVIVVTSYRQTVMAYPRGGGSYIVTKENIGVTPGLVAAGALLTDYVLTVAVSVAAGAFAVASLVPSLLDHRVALSLGFIVFIAVANLRGVRESGTLFAIPTYSFTLAVLLTIGAGALRCLASGCPEAEIAEATRGIERLAFPATQGVTLWMILRAFSSGSTALTGVEAIADGVAAFRRPQARNAATTLALLGAISITMFLGITILANRTHVRPIDAGTAERITRLVGRPVHERSVLAQIGEAVFGGGPGFAFLQVTTALVLILAANTAFQDFPRLSSILAGDRFMPRQFVNRGDRLVFSNGIILLALFASALIVAYDAEVTRLIQLYVVGVFTSFTLSQTGMVLRWRRLQPPGWRRRAAVNAVGAATTGVVLVVVASTKFTHGAWIVITAVPLIVALFKGINRHYRSVAAQLRAPEARPRPAVGIRALVLVPRIDQATMRALGYARALRPLELRALHVSSDGRAEALVAEWAARGIGVPLDVVGDGADAVEAVRQRVRALRRGPDEYVAFVLPERIEARGVRGYLRQRRELLLKATLLLEPQVVVTDVPTAGPEAARGAGGPIAPTRNVALLLVSGVHNATLRALSYARAIRPTELRAITFNVDETETARIMRDWAEAEVDLPLEVLDSPYREVTRPLVRLVREVRDATPDTVVTVILPEFVVARWYHQFLHNQTALAIKAALLFEPGVVVTSVPFHLTVTPRAARRQPGAASAHR
jgi:amino acid transporter